MEVLMTVNYVQTTSMDGATLTLAPAMFLGAIYTELCLDSLHD